MDSAHAKKLGGGSHRAHPFAQRPADIRRRVRDRSGNRYEYRRSRQEDEPFIAYQVEHVVPKQYGGRDDEANLALACPQCNLPKDPNLAGIDPETNTLEPLFHPRRQDWADHFAVRGPTLIGKTPTGRTTVRVLAMNAPPRIDLRRQALDEPTG